MHSCSVSECQLGTGHDKLYPEEWVKRLQTSDPTALKSILKRAPAAGKSSKSPDDFFNDLLTQAEQR